MERVSRADLVDPAVAARYARRFPRGRALAVAAPSGTGAGTLVAPGEGTPDWRLWAVGAALALAGIAEWVQAAFTIAGSDRLIWFHRDFPALYAAGRLVLDGAGDRLYDTASIAQAEFAAAGHPVGATGVLGYFNPPFFAGVIAPLTRLPLEDAYRVWTVSSLGLMVLGAWLIWLIAANLPRASRLVLVLAFLTMFPLTYGLQIGQFSLILLTAWASAYLLLRSGHSMWAGVALSALLIKPELLLLVVGYLLWKRQWAVFATLAPISAIAIAASLLIVGPANALGYPSYLLDSTTWQGSGIATNVMFDWNGLVAMLWDPSEVRFALALVAVLSAITVVAVMRAGRGSLDVASDRFVVQWALLTVATLLVDPHLYLQDTVLLAPAAAAMLALVPTGSRARVAIVLLGGWALLELGVYPNEHLHINAFTIYLAAAGVALLAQLRRRPGVASSTYGGATQRI